jgi:ligand-binding SRPBCC domain-containing protein
VSNYVGTVVNLQSRRRFSRPISMPIIKLEIKINAPVERVFDLSRSIDLHKATMSRHNEIAVAGVTSGLINLGETVTWKITGFDRPRYFRDSMVSGAFARFDHEHFFEEIEKRTLLRDTFDYDSPLWIFGSIADWLFLENYMKNMLEERNRVIKEIAEGDDWQKFIS